MSSSEFLGYLRIPRALPKILSWEQVVVDFLVYKTCKMVIHGRISAGLGWICDPTPKDVGSNWNTVFPLTHCNFPHCLTICPSTKNFPLVSIFLLFFFFNIKHSYATLLHLWTRYYSVLMIPTLLVARLIALPCVWGFTEQIFCTDAFPWISATYQNLCPFLSGLL